MLEWLLLGFLPFILLRLFPIEEQLIWLVSAIVLLLGEVIAKGHCSFGAYSLTLSHKHTFRLSVPFSSSCSHLGSDKWEVSGVISWWRKKYFSSNRTIIRKSCRVHMCMRERERELAFVLSLINIQGNQQSKNVPLCLPFKTVRQPFIF